MTHPHVLWMTAHTWAIRDALTAVDDVIRAEAITRPPIGQRATSAPRGYRSGPRSITRLSALIHSRNRAALRTRERTGQLDNARAGIHPVGCTRAPVRAELLDLARDGAAALERALEDCAWIVASSLRTRPLLVYGQAWRGVATGEHPAVTYLRVALPYAPQAVADETLSTMEHLARAAWATLRQEPPRRQVPGNPPCPACGTRLLSVQYAGPHDAWTITCGARCVCTGDTCECGMARRAEGTRHIWPSTRYSVSDPYDRPRKIPTAAAAAAPMLPTAVRAAPGAPASPSTVTARTLPPTIPTHR